MKSDINTVLTPRTAVPEGSLIGIPGRFANFFLFFDPEDIISVGQA